MAITKLGSVAQGGASASATVDATHTLVAGRNRIVIAIVGFDSAGTPNITGCVYDEGGDDIAMTALTEALVDSSGFRQASRMFYLLEADLPSTGGKTVRGTASGGSTGMQIVVIAIQDAKQEAPEADEINTATLTAAISKAITTLTNGAWIISGDSVGTNRTFTHGTGQTEEADFEHGGILSQCLTTEEKVSAGADTQTHTASSSANRHAMVLAAFAPAIVSRGKIFRLLYEQHEKVRGILQPKKGLYLPSGAFLTI